MKRVFAVFFLVCIIFLTGVANAATLRLPNGLKEIEEQAFYGDTSIDEVILSEGIITIGNQAFANSSYGRQKDEGTPEGKTHAYRLM